MSEGRRHTLDRCWRKSRIAARILLRHEAGKTTTRDVRLAQLLATDKGVTSRLILQAINRMKGLGYRIKWPDPEEAQRIRNGWLIAANI